jgi:hypothetical protein
LRILTARNHTIDTNLYKIINKKHTDRGRIARLNELLRDVLPYSVSAKTSFKERRIMNPTTTAVPY